MHDSLGKAVSEEYAEWVAALDALCCLGAPPTDEHALRNAAFALDFLKKHS